MEILEMTLNDFDLIKNVLQDEFDEFWNANILKSELENPNTKYIVAKDGKEIVGFAGILILPDIIEVMNIVVKKNKRRMGIGKKLLEELINIAKLAGLETLSLEVNYKNLPAKFLYESFGFKTVRIRKKYYNGIDDAIIMNLKL
jgi:ribosomal-protein-alanine N-acetyltransferase